MKIGRKESWYRPYYASVGTKIYQVEKIHFYKNDAILVSSQSGWLENKDGRDFESIDIPVNEIKRKNKVKFDGTVFVTIHKEKYGHETVAELYVPCEMFDIHFVENVLEYHRSVYAIYEGSNGIFIRKYIKSIDASLYAIRDEYEKVHKEVTDTSLVIVRPDIVLGNLDKLKELALQFYEEQKRLHELTIDDIELES